MHDSAKKPSATSSTTKRKRTQSLFATIRAYDTLMPLSVSVVDDYTTHNYITTVLNTITPFHDAIQTISKDSYPSIGLAITIIRRVRTVLVRQHNLLKEEIDDPDGVGGGGTPEEKLEFFHRSVQENFEKAFASILKENPDSMWTIPLDPRLIGMRGLSSTEKKDAKSKLIEAVEKIVKVDGRKQKPAPTPKESTRRPSASTMGGIFWGDDLDLADDHTDSNPTSAFSARVYAKKSIDGYFDTVLSERHVEDPLLWWKINQKKISGAFRVGSEMDLCVGCLWEQEFTR